MELASVVISMERNQQLGRVEMRVVATLVEREKMVVWIEEIERQTERERERERERDRESERKRDSLRGVGFVGFVSLVLWLPSPVQKCTK